jgi:hypothetical protein
MDTPKPKPPTVKLTPILALKKPEPKEIKKPFRRKQHLTQKPFEKLRENQSGDSK